MIEAVLSVVDSAFSDIGGLSDAVNWDGAQVTNPVDGNTGEKVETYDAVKPTDFSLLPVPNIPGSTARLFGRWWRFKTKGERRCCAQHIPHSDCSFRCRWEGLLQAWLRSWRPIP